MGQSSSKRRSFTPGKGKKAGASTLPRTNSEEANGGIEVVGSPHASGFGGRDAGTPMSPTSPASESPKSPTGKKDKRKRFRVGFSLKRTPSGRWTRKKKKPAQENGTRPVSWPNPVKEEMHETPGRPQSLFLEELDIEEDGNRIETVDLSDHEELKSSSGEKSLPKVPEKSKWKRGSQKKSSGKKKKKEKQAPKKDKKKKQKAGEDKVVITSFTVRQEETRESLTGAPPLTEEIQRTEIVSDQRVDKMVTSSTELPEPDIEAIASSIVAESVNIAQKRLQDESIAGVHSFQPEELNTECQRLAISTCESLSETPQACTNEAPPIVIEKVSTVDSAGSDSAVRLAHDIIADIMDKSHETESEHSVGFNNETEPLLIAGETDEANMTVTDDSEKHSYVLEQSSEPVDVNDAKENASFLENSAETETVACEDKTPDIVCTEVSRIEYEMADSRPQLECQIPEPLHDKPCQPETEETGQNSFIREADEHNHAEGEILGEKENEEMAKKIVQQVITAALARVHREGDLTEVCEDAEELKNEEFENQGTDSEKDKATLVNLQKKEKEKLEAESVEEEKEAKETKTEEEAMLMEGKVDQKIEKEKVKNETKFKVSKKLINWFHRRDKQSKTGSEIDIGIPGTHNITPPVDLNNPQVTYTSGINDTLVNFESAASVEPQQSSPLISANDSLVLDVNVTLLAVAASTATETSSESSPSDSSSPTSPNSEANEPSPSSSAEGKKSGSGFMKKISLGPRLRTAILRKKSSDASDGQEKNKVSLTQPRTVDATLPSREQRGEKTAEQNRPATSSVDETLCVTASNPQSPAGLEISTVESTPHSELNEMNAAVDDSGVADLTSPEGNRSDLSCVDEYDTDNVVQEDKDVVQVASHMDAPSLEPFCTSSINVKERLSTSNVNVIEDDDEDDTRPLTPVNSFETFSSIVKRARSMDYFSPLQSPTMVSTATIVLRIASTEDQQHPVDGLQAAETHPTLGEKAEEFRATSDKTEPETAWEHDSWKSPTLASCSPFIEEHISKSAELEHQPAEPGIFYTESSTAESLPETSEMWRFVKSDFSRQLKHEPFSDDQQEIFFNEENHLRVKTVAEYRIGLTADLEDGLEAWTVKECQAGVSEQPGLSDRVKDNSSVSKAKESIADPCLYNSEMNTNEKVVMNQETFDCLENIPACNVLGDFTFQGGQNVFETEHNDALNSQNGGNSDNLEDSIILHDDRSNGLTLSQPGISRNNVSDVDDIRNNGYPDVTQSESSEFIEVSKYQNIDRGQNNVFYLEKTVNGHGKAQIAEKITDGCGTSTREQHDVGLISRKLHNGDNLREDV